MHWQFYQSLLRYLLHLKFFLSLIFCWWCLHLQFLTSFLGFLFPSFRRLVFSLLFLLSLLGFGQLRSFPSPVWLCFPVFKEFICFLCKFVFLYFFQWLIYILLKGLYYLHEIGLLGQLPSCLCAEELLGCLQAMVSSWDQSSRQSSAAEGVSWKSVWKREKSISLK